MSAASPTPCKSLPNRNVQLKYWSKFFNYSNIEIIHHNVTYQNLLYSSQKGILSFYLIFFISGDWGVIIKFISWHLKSIFYLNYALQRLRFALWGLLNCLFISTVKRIDSPFSLQFFYSSKRPNRMEFFLILIFFFLFLLVFLCAFRVEVSQGCFVINHLSMAFRGLIRMICESLFLSAQW